MCGRFAFFSPREAITQAFPIDLGVLPEPRFNIAPSQNVLIIRSNDTGSLVAESFRWGLVPFWAKDPAIGNRMINARAETIAEKPSYRQSFKRRRWLMDSMSGNRMPKANVRILFVAVTGSPSEWQAFGISGPRAPLIPCIVAP
jgi:putative SOS response-associated peptidase YedK